MKKLIVIVSILVAFSCKAQLNPTGVIPIEDFENYQGEVPDGTYIKDVNQLLDKYTGSWEGTFEGKLYEISIVPEKITYLGIDEDILLLRYKITGEDNQELINTLNISSGTRVVKGTSIEDGGEPGEYYVLDYFGEESQCGQKGNIYLTISQNNPDQMRLFLAPSNEYIVKSKCPDGSAQQLFPTDPGNQLYLTKQ